MKIQIFDFFWFFLIWVCCVSVILLLVLRVTLWASCG